MTKEEMLHTWVSPEAFEDHRLREEARAAQREAESWAEKAERWAKDPDEWPKASDAWTKATDAWTKAAEAWEKARAWTEATDAWTKMVDTCRKATKARDKEADILALYIRSQGFDPDEILRSAMEAKAQTTQDQ